MKNTFMTRFAYLFGLAALVPAIALCFAACSGGDDGKTLDSIAVTTQPTKTSYNLGENLDLNGMVITATYSDGSTITVAVTGYTTRGYDKNTEGDQTITVTYQGKTAAFTVTVVDPNKDPTPITGVSINIAAPVKAASPSGAAVVNTDNVTAGTVTWSPDDSLFLGGTEYTATVTLTAASGFTFTGLETASVNSQDADVSDNSGSSVTLSYTFPATLDKIVGNMEITAQPAKMIYSHEETLDLSGLTVQLIFDDGTTSGIAFADFADNNITVSPAHGVTLTAADNNGHPVTVSYGEITKDTAVLTVNPIDPVLADFNISGAETFTYDGSVKEVTVTAINGKTTGSITVKYNDIETAPSGAGTYAVTFNAAADANYQAITLSAGTLTINKASPVAGDYDISNNLSQLAGSSVTAVTVTPQSGKSPVTPTVYYAGTNGTTYTKSTTMPTASGVYTVTFDVAADDNWNEATGLSAGTLALSVFSSAADLQTALAAAADNSAASPYQVALKVSSLAGIADTLQANDTKYVSLDLTGSTLISMDHAFRDCATLTDITIPDSITSIGSYTFYNCSSLTSITIPDSVTSIGTNAFYNCTSLESITIPDGVTSIGSQAFMYCANLTGVTIPNSVTSIEETAFFGCSSLTSVTIPDSVTSIGQQAFQGCSSLASIIIIPDGVTSIERRVFYGCSSLTSVTIPNSVTSIGVEVFRDCSSLTGVTIPNGVTSIGESAFQGCSSLESIDIPDSVTSIGQSTFRDCSSFESVTIPNGVTSIESSTFSSCRSLTSVTIPDSVTSIGNGAFYVCSGLESITIGNSVTSIGDSAFFGCNKLSITWHYNPALAATNIRSYVTEVIIPEGVTTIGYQAFEGCSSLTSVDIPDSVTSIGQQAFQDCAALTAITIPDGVTTIGEYAFRSCTSLTEITIPDGVTNIGIAAFQECSSLISVAIPDSVTSIGGHAFYFCSNLTSITIPDSITSIGSYTFYNCSSLTSVTFEEMIAEANLDTNAFHGLGDLRDKYLAGGIGTYTRPSGSSTTWTKQ